MTKSKTKFWKVLYWILSIGVLLGLNLLMVSLMLPGGINDAVVYLIVPNGFFVASIAFLYMVIDGGGISIGMMIASACCLLMGVLSFMYIWYALNYFATHELQISVDDICSWCENYL